MMKTMAEYIDLDTPLELKAVWGSTYKPYTSTLRELLDVNHIPYTAADVRPVVRGKWEPVVAANEDGSPYQAGIRCSECCHFDVWEFNFCPNCGANMEES